MRTCSIIVLLAACGGSPTPPTTPPPSNVTTPIDATAAPAKVDCDEVCTTYAVCWEEHHAGEDFRGGGACVSSCEEMSESDRTTWAKDIEDASSANDCKRLFVEDEE